MLTLVSSLAQALSAILLVVTAALVLRWATKDLILWTEAWLAPASAIAIAGIGILLIARGLRDFLVLRSDPKQNPSDGCGCGHAHGPSVSQMQSLSSTKDALVIIASIAMRPCTGALFLLVIALRMDILAIGSLAVVTMSLGTASFNLIIAASGVTARRLAALPLDGYPTRLFSACLHIAGGALIAFASLALAQSYLACPFLSP